MSRHAFHATLDSLSVHCSATRWSIDLSSARACSLARMMCACIAHFEGALNCEIIDVRRSQMSTPAIVQIHSCCCYPCALSISLSLFTSPRMCRIVAECRLGPNPVEQVNLDGRTMLLLAAVAAMLRAMQGDCTRANRNINDKFQLKPQTHGDSFCPQIEWNTTNTAHSTQAKKGNILRTDDGQRTVVHSWALWPIERDSN